jgi:hypothetical protein
MNSSLEQNLEVETVFVFYRTYSYIHWSINDNYLVKKCLNFPDFFNFSRVSKYSVSKMNSDIKW